MESSLLAAMFLLVVFVPGVAYVPDSRSGPTLHPVLEERLRSVQVTEPKLSLGTVFPEARFSSSLQPNVDLGRIALGIALAKLPSNSIQLL